MSETQGPIHLREGQLVLYKKAGSNNYYLRYKLKGGGWKKFSTKTPNLTIAKQVAGERYDEYLLKVKLRLDTNDDEQPLFGKVANEYVKRLNITPECLDENGKLKQTYYDYTLFVKNVLNPVLGKIPINKINEGDLLKVDDLHVERLKKRPSKSTINHRNSCLKRIFEYGISCGYLKRTDIPQIKNRGVSSIPRPYFDDGEYQRLIRNSREWIKQTNQERSKQIRVLLHQLIRFIRHSGVRPFIETDNLRWKDITDTLGEDGEYRLKIHVKGKGKERTFVPKDIVRDCLEALKNRFSEYEGMTIKEMSRVDEKVFILPDGTQPYNMRRQFIKLVEYIGFEKPFSLYSLRSSYCVDMILDGWPVYSIALNMGTSLSMVQRYYSKVTPEMMITDLSRKFIDDLRPKITERGSIVITKRMLDKIGFGMAVGVSFDITNENGKLILSPTV